MSNIFPNNKIPSVEDEVPILQVRGTVLKNIAYHCRVPDLFPLKDGEVVEQSWLDAIALYLANFCRPVKNIAREVQCVACNTLLTRPNAAEARPNLVVSNEQSSEARCGNCGYPVRIKHTILNFEKNLVLVRLDFFPLCYHPNSTQ